jgi:hypothetical protein
MQLLQRLCVDGWKSVLLGRGVGGPLLKARTGWMMMVTSLVLVLGGSYSVAAGATRTGSTSSLQSQESHGGVTAIGGRPVAARGMVRFARTWRGCPPARSVPGERWSHLGRGLPPTPHRPAGLGCVEWWAELGGRVKGSLSWSVEVAVVTDVAVIWRSRSPEESERLQVNSRTHLLIK